LESCYLDRGDPAAGLKYLDQGLKLAKEYSIREMEANLLVDMARGDGKNRSIGST